MIDGSEKRNRQLAFELQNSHVCEKRSKFMRNLEGRVFRLLSGFFFWGGGEGGKDLTSSRTDHSN